MRQRPATKRPRRARRVQIRGSLRCTLRRMSHQPSSSRLPTRLFSRGGRGSSRAHCPFSGAGAVSWPRSVRQSARPVRRRSSKQLAASVARGDTPGVVALVVGRDGVLFEGAAGKLDAARNIPMPANAIFNIASMTKPVTSVAIMMLLEQGKLQARRPGVAPPPRVRQASQVITTVQRRRRHRTKPVRPRRAMTHPTFAGAHLGHRLRRSPARSSTGCSAASRRASGSSRSCTTRATSGPTARARACSG